MSKAAARANAPNPAYGAFIVDGQGVRASLTFGSLFSEARQCQEAYLVSYALVVKLEGANATDWELEGVASTMGVHPGSLYRDPAGREVHVALNGVQGTVGGQQHASGVIWKKKDGSGERLITAALYPPIPKPVQQDPYERHMGCDPVPEPQVIPTFSALNTDRAVHIGYVSTWRQSGPPQTVYGGLPLTAWLDKSVKGTVEGPVTAAADQGTVTVGAVDPPQAGTGPIVLVTYDPRLPDGRIAPGTHTIKLTWRVKNKGKVSELTGTIQIFVGENGNVHTIGNKGTRLDVDPLPLGLRFGATIEASRELDGAWRLAARLPLGLEGEDFDWRAPGARVERTGEPGVVRVVGGSGTDVTCIVRANESSLGIATRRLD